jgi:hypothetical protein
MPFFMRTAIRFAEAPDAGLLLTQIRTMRMTYETVMQFCKQQGEKKYMVVASPPSKPTLFYCTTLVNPPSGPEKV